MYETLTLLDLAGAVALLLWGVHMVQSGVQRALGSEFRRSCRGVLVDDCKLSPPALALPRFFRAARRPDLSITSFASCGFIALVPALAAMLGANVGTTLIVQVLSFNVSALSPLLLLVGVAAFRAGSTRIRDLGRVAIGLGLMLIALSRLLEVVTHYEDVPSLRILMGRIATDPAISALFGATMAWAAHSSVAVALLVMSLTGKGVLPLDAAIALMIGANIGTAINPLLKVRVARMSQDDGWRLATSRLGKTRRGRHAAHSLDRADAGSDRARLVPQGCRLPHRVQRCDRARVLAAPHARRAAARADPAEPRRGL